MSGRLVVVSKGQQRFVCKLEVNGTLVYESGSALEQGDKIWVNGKPYTVEYKEPIVKEGWRYAVLSGHSRLKATDFKGRWNDSSFIEET